MKLIGLLFPHYTKHWCIDNLPEDFFKVTANISGAYTQVVAWTAERSHHFQQNAINEFLDSDEADAFLIAFALAEKQNRIIVA